jgi:hypothetical protein
LTVSITVAGRLDSFSRYLENCIWASAAISLYEVFMPSRQCQSSQIWQFQQQWLSIQADLHQVFVFGLRASGFGISSAVSVLYQSKQIGQFQQWRSCVSVRPDRIDSFNIQQVGFQLFLCYFQAY